jgi:hypothetical protein
VWNPFKKNRLLSEEDELFMFECFRWLLTHFGGEDFYRTTKLILPTQEFFPDTVDSDVAAAESIFAKIKKYAGMETWPCHLKAQDGDDNITVAPTVSLKNVGTSPLGTFSTDESEIVTITYNPRLVSQPTQLVATLAHEISHYLTATAPKPPPGGWDNWEFATDVCATFLGFGIFVANSAFNFRQFTDVDSQGWESSRHGYLSEAEHSYALAVFLKLKGIAPKTALKHCDPNIRKYLKHAWSELGKNAEIARLREIQFVPQNS